jgi:hypothetical protein
MDINVDADCVSLSEANKPCRIRVSTGLVQILCIFWT